MEKKGLSAVVGTILIILLVIVAVGIIWAVASGLFKGGAEEMSTGFLIDMDIKSATLGGDGKTVSISVKRNVGAGTLSGIKFVFSDGESSKGEEKTTSMGQLDRESFSFDISSETGLGIPDAYEVSIAPIYKSESGEDILRNIVDRAKLEAVDGGGEPPGNGAVCGNNVIEGTEVCDGSDLNEETCETQGYTGGTLACFPEGHASECTFDTSACTGGTCTDGETQDCPNQEGVCEGSFQTCTGSTWPGCDYSGITGYETIEVTCTDTLDNDCDGTTDYDDTDCEQTWTGTIAGIWPSETKLYFEISEETPDFIGIDVNHAGRYISFSSETRCIQIQDYVLPKDPLIYNKAIVKLDESLVPIGIAIDDSFTIWSSSTTCT